MDTDGLRYLVWKEDGNSQNKPTLIWLQRLKDDGTKLVGERHGLSRKVAPCEGGLVEGPFILRRGGWFYLYYSTNGCCGADRHYALGVARSHSLFGPWEKTRRIRSSAATRLGNVLATAASCRMNRAGIFSIKTLERS